MSTIISFIPSLLEYIAVFLLFVSVIGNCSRRRTAIFICICTASVLIEMLAVTQIPNIIAAYTLPAFIAIPSFIIAFADRCNVLNLLTCYCLGYAVISVYELGISIFIVNVCGLSVTFMSNTVSLLILCILLGCICHTKKAARLEQLISRLSITYKFIICYCFVAAVTLNILFNYQTDSFYSQAFLIVIILISVITLNFTIIRSQSEQITLQKRLQCYDEYMPIVNNLIDEIRTCEHDYNNRLNALMMLSVTCSDISELRSRMTDNSFEREFDTDLLNALKLNKHLLAGLLISKYRLAANNHKTLHIDINCFQIASTVPEFLIVEMCGNLLDNAIENAPVDSHIYTEIDSFDNKFVFGISNEAPLVSSDLILKMFKKGYTTKTEAGSHGNGLYKLSRTVTQYNGSIDVSNELRDGVNHICFKLSI